MNFMPYQNRAEDAVSLGVVLTVRGSEAHVGLNTGVERAGSDRPTVGKFLAIETGTAAIVGMIADVSSRRPRDVDAGHFTAVARIELMGEILKSADGTASFRRGVRDYPIIGDPVRMISNVDLRLIYKPPERDGIAIGYLNLDPTIPAFVDIDNLLTKHFALLGSTGVGKSSGVSVILNETIKARPQLRALLLDAHNEYGHCFGDRAYILNAGNLRLPFWLFNFEEFTDIIYGGRQVVPEEIEILAELIPIAKVSYQQMRSSPDRLVIKKKDPSQHNMTADTPIPYLLQDLISLIDERMGKLENRSSRMVHRRLIMRIEALKNDTRYAFMFESANVGGDTLAQLLSQLFRLEQSGQPITLLQLASLPVEVVDAVVCLVTRFAFEFGLWSDGQMPLLLVCEEAHRYAAADQTAGFAPVRRSLARIAKEGRKYGVYLGLVSQRPAELDPTIISQCSTLFAMRMTNDHDQSLLRSAVADAGADLLNFVPTLGTGEVVGFGEGMPLPTRLMFKSLEAGLLPKSESNAGLQGRDDNLDVANFVNGVVERWRGTKFQQPVRSDDSSNTASVEGSRATYLSALERGLNAAAADYR